MAYKRDQLDKATALLAKINALEEMAAGTIKQDAYNELVESRNKLVEQYMEIRKQLV